MEYRYKPTGVCSKEMIFDIENGIVKDLKVIGGCDGNIKGVASLIKGMPIEQVQKLLGHTKIDTTLQYAMVDEANVKLAHKKYIC